jgi:prefoldin subunit 5
VAATYYYLDFNNKVEIITARNGFIVKIGLDTYIARTLKEVTKIVLREHKPQKETR